MNMPDADGLLMADKAFLALRNLLTGGGLRAGQFVSMPDLMRILDMPMAPVREAVKRLATTEPDCQYRNATKNVILTQRDLIPEAAKQRLWAIIGKYFE